MSENKLEPVGDCGRRSFNAGLRYCGLPDITCDLKTSGDLAALAREYGLDVYERGRVYSAKNEPVLVIYRDGKTATNGEYHAVFASDIAPWRSTHVIIVGWNDLRDRSRTTLSPREIREVLEGLAIRRHIDHKSWCWCQKRWDATKPHDENCQRARDLWAKLQPLPSENPGDTLRE